jgi:hypothetical protein
VEITLTYTEEDLAALDENSLFLAVWDEDAAAWVDAATVCPGAIRQYANRQSTALRRRPAQWASSPCWLTCPRFVCICRWFSTRQGIEVKNHRGGPALWTAPVRF